MRCFVAIELPVEVRKRLAELQARLADLDRVVRWTRSEQMHLTLKFLGEVPDSQVPQICSAAITAVAGLQTAHLEICGAGCFPPRGPARVVWVGVRMPCPELSACHQACERAFAAMGYPPEKRPFRPHLTIGRTRDSRGAPREARAVLEAFADFSAGSFEARELVVFQSVLSSSGATHTPLARSRLGG